MKTLLRASITTIAVALLGVSTYGETGFLDRSVTMNGQQFGYQVYVPREFTPTRTWPIIVFLHGAGQMGRDSLAPTNYGWGPITRRDRSLVPAIVLFPQAAQSWVGRDMQDLAMLQLDKTIEEFRGDPSRIYLTGFSMGAAGAYRIAHRWPERFAALFVVAGAVESSAWRFPGSDARDREANPFTSASDPFAVLAAGIRSLPIWMFHGDADKDFSVEQSRRLAAALKSVNARVEYTEYAGVNHGEAAAKAFNAKESISWLLAQHR